MGFNYLTVPPPRPLAPAHPGNQGAPTHLGSDEPATAVLYGLLGGGDGHQAIPASWQLRRKQGLEPHVTDPSTVLPWCRALLYFGLQWNRGNRRTPACS